MEKKGRLLDFQSKDMGWLGQAFQSKLTGAKELRDLSAAIETEIKGCGYSHYMFLRLDRTWEDGTDDGILTNFDQRLIRLYIDSYSYLGDVVLDHISRKKDLVYTHELYNDIGQLAFDFKFKKTSEFINNLFNRYGFTTLSVASDLSMFANNYVALYLGKEGARERHLKKLGAKQEKWKRSLCRCIDSVVHTHFMKSFSMTSYNASKLSDESLLIANMIANSDLSLVEIAESLSITEFKLREYMYSFRKAFCAQTDVAAIIKAIQLGYVGLEREITFNF